MWCDVVGQIQKDCGDFTEAMRSNVMYLWNGRVHASETRRALDLNVRRGGMKRLMEEAAARHAETVHYSALARIRVGGGEARKTNEPVFWSLMLEGLARARLRTEEADRYREENRPKVELVHQGVGTGSSRTHAASCT